MNPAGFATPSLLADRELLTSYDDGRFLHARYPTGLKALCGRLAPPRPPGRPAKTPAPPTCGLCAATAAVFHTIDGSCPPNWQPVLEAA